ncbi:hypothetical protein ACWDKQ_35095, partial [Saccharopolyspora sp. NPDC000995]
MTNPRDDQQLQLRWELVSYLAGDLNGGADTSIANALLSATVTSERGDKHSVGRQIFQRRVAIGMSFSGLPDSAAVERMLRNEALEDALRGDYTIASFGARFNRSVPWGRKVIDEAKALISELRTAGEALRQILVEAEADTDLWNVYDAKIAEWLDLDGVRLDAIRSRAEEAVAAVQQLRERLPNNAIPEMRDSFETADGGLRQWGALHGPDPVGQTFADADQHFGRMQDDPSWNVVPHRPLTHGGRIGDAQALLQDWNERYERAAAQMHEWVGIAGHDAVHRLLADADGILGPLRVSWQFRNVLAHWLGENPGDWHGAQAVRVELAGYLAGDPDIGVVVSGLPRDAFEAVRVEEARWQEVGAGNQAEVGAVAVSMVRGVDDDPALRVTSQTSSVKRRFAEAGRALRQVADEQGQGAVDGLYAAADEVLGSLKESQPFRDVMAHELMTNPPDAQQLQLRWELVSYLAGDLSGGADTSTADDLLSATVPPELGANADKVRRQLMYRRRVAIGKAFSGLSDGAVERVLRNEARDYALREEIAKWLPINRNAQVQAIRSRVEEAVAAVQELRERLLNNAIPETRDSSETVDGGLPQWGALHGPDEVGQTFADADQHFGGMQDDPSRNAVADAQALRDWDERYVRAATQLHEWVGIAGHDAVGRLLADADGILGPLRVSWQFRNVLAHWLGENPGDWHGAQDVRAELADYLAGDPGIGVAVSGLTLDAFEEVRAEEERRQADRAGNQAEAAVVAVPMVRGFDDDPALRVFSRVGSVRRRFAEAGRALRQVADEQGQDAVDGLYAAADEVLGSLKESQPFRDVMAHQLMTNPPDAQEVQELRWELVSYLAGDLSGGADTGTSNNLLSALDTRDPEEIVSRAVQGYYRCVAVGKALSGLPDDNAVKKVLRNEAREEALRGDYTTAALGARYNRSHDWGNKVLAEVKKSLTSDLQASVDSLRQILAGVGAHADLQNEYETKIGVWLDLKRVRVAEIRDRVHEAADAVRELWALRERLRNDAIRELRAIFGAADWLRQFEDLSGPNSVVQAFLDVDRHFGRMQDDQLRRAVVHWWVTYGAQIGDARDRIGSAEAFVQRLHRLQLAAMAVSAGAGPEPGRDVLSQSTEDVSGYADTGDIGDTESVFDEAELERLRERLDRLRGEAESSEGPMPAAGVQQSQGSAGASDGGGPSRWGIDRYGRSGDVVVGGGSGSDGSGGGVSAGGVGAEPGSEISAEGESDSDAMGSAGFGAVAEPGDRAEEAGESRANGATSSTEADRADEARGVVEHYVGMAGGRAALADAIGLHHQERGFGRFGSRWVRNYEQRLVNIARLMLDLRDSAAFEGAPSVLGLRNVRRLFDAVRHRYPDVGETVTIDHVRRLVRDFNPDDERPVSDADVRMLVTLIPSAKDLWGEVSFDTLRRVWRTQTAPMEMPGREALRALEPIVSQLTANRARLEANGQGLLARVEDFLDNVREEMRTHWRPTDRSRVTLLSDLRVSGEWLVQEMNADVSDPAVAVLVALAQEHGGGRAVAQAAGVDSQSGAWDRQSPRDAVNRVWERLTNVARLAVARDGDQPTLDQLRQAADIARLRPRVQGLRVQGADPRLGPMPADLDEAGLAGYLRSVVELWAERPRQGEEFGGAAVRAVTENDVHHLADLMMS